MSTKSFTNPFEFMNNLWTETIKNNNMSDLNKNSFSSFGNSLSNPFSTSFNNMVENATDILNAANEAVTQNVQSVLKLGAEFGSQLSEDTAQAINTTQAAFASGDIGNISTSSQKYIQSTVENNMRHTKELIKITSESTSNFLSRVEENLGKKTSYSK